jgi:N utilization substance protein A
LTALAGVGPKTIEKIEAAGISNVEKLASMTPEQLMEIPGIGEKMVDKIYQAVNRFYEGGEAAAATEGIENTDTLAEESDSAEGATQEAGAESTATEEASTAASEAGVTQAPEETSEAAATGESQTAEDSDKSEESSEAGASEKKHGAEHSG